MNVNDISFDNIPKAIAHILNELQELRQLFEKIQTPPAPKRRLPIDIDEACRIIGKAKPTVYALVQKRLLPCYKNGKKLYFFEDELLNWVTKGKKKTIQEIEEEAAKSTRRMRRI